MHYANGRIAKNGDKVLLLPNYGSPLLGILYDAQAGNNDCNGKLAPCSPSDPMPDLKSCLHYDDVAHLFAQKAIPDASSATIQPGKPAEYDPEAVTAVMAKLKMCQKLLTDLHAVRANLGIDTRPIVELAEILHDPYWRPPTVEAPPGMIASKPTEP